MKRPNHDTLNLSLAKRLCSDRDVVLRAVRTFRHFILYANQKLRHDKEIALEAVRSFPKQHGHLPKALQEDIDIIVASTLAFDDGWTYVHTDKKYDKQVLVKCIHKLNCAQSRFHKFRDDRELVVASGDLSWASVRLKSDFDTCVQTVKKCPEKNLPHVDKALFDNRKFFRAVRDHIGQVLVDKYFSERILSDPTGWRRLTLRVRNAVRLRAKLHPESFFFKVFIEAQYNVNNILTI